ncbi:MAG: ATP-binding cassette domain-containing protein [Xanthobacteraceae bacterium]
MSSLQIEALCVKLHSVEVLRGISLKLAPGEMIGLLGRNGAGKTTTLRAVMGLVAASGGRITCAGENLLALPTHRRTALGIGYMPEDRRLIPQLTVQENVLLPGWVTRGVNAAARLDFVYGLMPEVAAMRDRKAMALSGGQQKLVALARALIVGTRLLLLDEPFEGVAPALSRRLAEVIGLLRGEDIAVLIAQSDLNHTISLLDREYRIERGANR